MALPHLKPTFYAQRHTYENDVIRRNYKEDYLQQWSNNVKYFQQSDIKSNKDSEWSSEKSFKNSLNAYRNQTSKDEYERNIRQRRNKLAQLFENERNEYQAELEYVLLKENSSVSVLKNRAEKLKSAREEERKKEAERLFYEHFQRNNPELRKIESEIINKEVVDYWPQQIKLKMDKEEQMKQEEIDLEGASSARQQLEEDMIKGNFQKRVLQEKYLKDSLKKQIDDIKKKEEEAKMLKEQEAKLLRMEQEIEEYNEKRRLVNEAKARQEYGRSLLRQHTAVMRRRSQQVQEELEADIRFLSYLAERDDQENEIQINRKEQAKADILWMQEAMEDQLRKEREREAELDNIFAEEAARLWSKRENEWNKEKIARENLMAEVYNERKLQVQKKLMESRQNRLRSIQEREEILKDIERDKHLIEHEVKNTHKKKDEFRLDLDNQKSARIQNEKEEKDRLRHEMDEEKQDELAYERLLEQEARRLRITGITPRSARR